MEWKPQKIRLKSPYLVVIIIIAYFWGTKATSN